jgi:hypothetical protein
MPGWLIVAAVVTAIDVHAGLTGRPMLSTSFRDASREHPMLISGTTLYLLGHLYGAVPARVDPLTRLGTLPARRKS